MAKLAETYLTADDVGEAYIKGMLKADFDEMVGAMLKHLNKKIRSNLQAQRKADFEEWRTRERKERGEERVKASKHNLDLEMKVHLGEYVDPNEYWMITPGPTAITVQGFTVCGNCLGMKTEKMPGWCHRKEWHGEKTK